MALSLTASDPLPSDSVLHGSPKQRFHIAGLVVSIDCHVPACLPAITSLCTLYARADTPPSLCFLLVRHAREIQLSCNGEMLWRGDDAGEVAAAFEYHLYRLATQALSEHLVSLHAAALASGGRAFLFVGPSGAGKSSLATQGLLNGMDYLSDEFALLDTKGRVHPFPRPLQWGKSRHPAFRHGTLLASGVFRKAGYSFPDYKGRSCRSLLWLPTRVVHQPQAIRALILPGFQRQASPAGLHPLQRSQALLMLARELHQRAHDMHAVQLLHEYLPPALPIFALPYSDVRQAWRAIGARFPVP